MEDDYDEWPEDYMGLIDSEFEDNDLITPEDEEMLEQLFKSGYAHYPLAGLMLFHERNLNAAKNINIGLAIALEKIRKQNQKNEIKLYVDIKDIIPLGEERR